MSNVAIARQRIDRALATLALRHPHAMALARYASLAVRVDSVLLRRLRLSLRPGADAGSEAELWFAGLAESQGVGGFVFEPTAQAALRSQLASEILPDGRAALAAAWAVTESLHRTLPPSLRIEEEVTWRALRGLPEDGVAIESLLRPAIKAMAENAQRGVEVARWALRAMPRLPEPARRGDAALALAIAAAARLGAAPRMGSAEMPRGLPADLAWVLPPLTERTRLVCETFADALVLTAPGAAQPQALILDVPQTRPVWLELDCQSGGDRILRMFAVEPGVAVPLPAGWTTLSLRTLAGDRYRIRRVGQAVPRLGGDAGLPAVATVLRSNKPVGSAVFIAQDRALTVASVLDQRTVERIGRGLRPESAPVMLRVAGRLLKAEVIEADLDTSLVLLAVWGAKSDPLPRHAVDVSPGSDAVIVSVDHDRSVPAQVTAVSVQIRARAEQDGRKGPYLQLAVPLDPAELPGWAGAPVLVGGELAGMIDPYAESGADPVATVYAQPASRIGRFLGWALRPGEHAVELFMPSWRVPLPEDPLARQIDRVLPAVQRAKLRLMPREPADEQAAVQAVIAAEAALCLSPPAPHSLPGLVRRERLAVAFRKWAQPDFPVLELTAGSAVASEALGSLRGKAIALESLDDLALARLLRERLDFQRPHAVGQTGPVDPTAWVTRLRSTLRELVPDDEDIGAALAAVGRHGLGVALKKATDWVRRAGQRDAGQAWQLLQQLAALGAPQPVPAPPLRSQQSDRSTHTVAFDGTPIELVQALWASAWSADATPPLFELPNLADVERLSVLPLRDALAGELVDALGCDFEEAQWLMSNPTARYGLLLPMQAQQLNPKFADALGQIFPGSTLLLAWPRSPDNARYAARLRLPLVSLAPAQENAFSSEYHTLWEVALARPHRRPTLK